MWATLAGCAGWRCTMNRRRLGRRRGLVETHRQALIQAAGCNLGLLLRRLTGVGTPPEPAGAGSFGALRTDRASDRPLGPSDARLGTPMDTGGVRRLNPSSPTYLNRPARRTDFFHGLPRAWSTRRAAAPRRRRRTTQASAARARAIVMETERRLGFEPTDREFEKLGYDIESRVPTSGSAPLPRGQGAPERRRDHHRHAQRDPLLAEQAGGLHPRHRRVPRRRNAPRPLRPAAVPARAGLRGGERQLRAQGLAGRRGGPAVGALRASGEAPEAWRVEGDVAGSGLPARQHRRRRAGQCTIHRSVAPSAVNESGWPPSWPRPRAAAPARRGRRIWSVPLLEERGWSGKLLTTARWHIGRASDVARPRRRQRDV